MDDELAKANLLNKNINDMKIPYSNILYQNSFKVNGKLVGMNKLQTSYMPSNQN